MSDFQQIRCPKKRCYGFVNQIDDFYGCKMEFSKTRKLCDISSNGRRCLFDIGWGFLVRDFVEGKSWNLPYSNDTVSNNLLSPFLLRAIFSPCGQVIATMYSDGRLMLLDIKHGNVAFEYKIIMKTFIDIVFDRTGRWLFVLHDHQKLETFQLLWDCGND